ncbi:PREDICTED: uncharacterized protein LOC108769774 [Trachymyrmex cornetzi]|uniref:uncharacterized protein LOC108769774 n=1 Tax=Trachymyrmex cornetzi TaxID=471704 RepID=UPI00084F0BDA|nr:PREDICTED: uncharacterized protein LOC108769774 [Trachymyrmex cornetzi]
MWKTTKLFLEQNKNILLTRADKGNVTVAMDAKDYKQKMLSLLNDDSTYEIIRKNPICNLTRKLGELLILWKNKDYITKQDYNYLYVSDGSLPGIYGLPTIHKVDVPLRIIVSAIDSTLYPLASFLHKIISKVSLESQSYIKNSFHLIEIIKNISLGDNDVLVSLDVVSLFTNVPLDLAMDSINYRWSSISKNIKIDRNEFMKALKLVFESAFFSYDNTIFRQKYGMPMSSPLSPVIADLVLQDLEMKALSTLEFHLPLYVRYVDDVALAVPSEKTNAILEVFNSFHPRLQFTIEVGGTTLNYLDLTLIKVDKKLEYDWFHKPTFSGRYLNFISEHPISQKKGTIISMVDRAFLLSVPKYHKKNLKIVIETLLMNDYPLEFIFDTINERLKSLVHKKTLKQKKNDEIGNAGLDNKRWFLVPYINNITNRFKNVVKDLNVKLSFFSLNKLNCFIKAQKDQVSSLLKRNVVYKISCSDCDVSYVGQTKRTLATRVKEHKNDIKKRDGNLSVISEHRLSSNHEFNWEDVEILDSERWLYKRRISEMLHIKLQNNGINLQSDTDLLHNSYV